MAKQNKYYNYKESDYKDPTINVRKLVETAAKHVDELHKAETRRVDEQMVLHFSYIAELREAETSRINAIRAVDVAAVAIASEKAAAQAVVLASQVTASAETLRNLVSAQALTVATQIQQVSQQMTDRIALLEKSQYENQGRSGISTPLLVTIATFIGGIIVFTLETLFKMSGVIK